MAGSARHADLFAGTAYQRPTPQRPRVMMHVVDAGNLPGGGKGIVFECRRCRYNTGWLHDNQTVTANKRGLPCPRCNRGVPDDPNHR